MVQNCFNLRIEILIIDRPNSLTYFHYCPRFNLRIEILIIDRPGAAFLFRMAQISFNLRIEILIIDRAYRFRSVLVRVCPPYFCQVPFCRCVDVLFSTTS